MKEKQDIYELIKNSKLIAVSIFLSTVILAIGISWALANADKVSIETGTIKVELSNN
jgi:hypothetical protein